MNTLKAPQKSVTRSAASIPALLLLGTLSGSALASTEIQAPCPESDSDTLHTILDGDARHAPLVRTVDSSDTATTTPVANSATDVEKDAEEASDANDPSLKDLSLPQFTTRLPGVSANDMPRFRRHMFRTDI